VQRPPVNRTNPLARIRFQLGGAILVAALLPYVLRISWPDTAGFSVHVTFMSSMIAIMMGDYFLRSITVYPGVKAPIFVAPIFLGTFAMVLAGLVLARIDYSRIVLVSSVILCIGWYVVVLVATQSARRMRIGLVPFGDVDSLMAITEVDWLPLVGPEVPPVALDGVVADLRADISPEWERRIAAYTLGGTIVYHSKNLSETLTGKVQIDHLSENTFGSLMPVAAYLQVKLVLDWIIALVLLPFVAVAMIPIAILVKLDSPGPIVFRQTRIGYRGKPFTVYKIRTMAIEGLAGERKAAAITADNDPRITRLGRFLRRMRIDELPQIVNILKGEMSWIGPRPEAMALSEWYANELPFYDYRHVVRPGITGWAQVNQGHVAEVHEVREKLQNDFYYIKYFSPWLDVLIVIRTIETVLTGFGSR
jgi:lipopolysaccharide/colanic/teichoic acid biosynthesis glycosyltransferase